MLTDFWHPLMIRLINASFISNFKLIIPVPTDGVFCANMLSLQMKTIKYVLIHERLRK